MRSGDSELLQASRWALYAEKAVGMLHHAQDAAGINASGLTGPAMADALRAKLAGAELRDTLRIALLLDGDGDG